MSEDIVTRLRDAAGLSNHTVPSDALLEEAADEIERLRAALQKIADLNGSMLDAAPYAQAVLDLRMHEAADEIERLRAQLAACHERTVRTEPD